jgi:hypothetical protein
MALSCLNDRDPPQLSGREARITIAKMLPRGTFEVDRTNFEKKLRGGDMKNVWSGQVIYRSLKSNKSAP